MMVTCVYSGSKKMSKIEHVFFDFDGLLFDTFPMFAKYYGDKYSIPIKAEHFHSVKDAFALVTSFGVDVTRNELYMECNDECLVSSQWHQAVTPYQGAQEVISALKDIYFLHVVTARQSTGEYVIRELCEKFFPGCIPYVHCAWYRENDTVVERPKIEYLDSHNSHGIFYDDTPEEILRAQKSQNVRCVLFDPYHSFSNTSHIRERVHSWEHIRNQLL